jgi:hypothetical protein
MGPPFGPPTRWRPVRLDAKGNGIELPKDPCWTNLKLPVWYTNSFVPQLVEEAGGRRNEVFDKSTVTAPMLIWRFSRRCGLSNNRLPAWLAL